METSASELIKNMVASGVRWVLVLAGGILVKKGIISTDQSAIYVAQAAPVVIGGAMTLVALGWSLWQKKHANTKVDVALALPITATRKTLEAKISEGATVDTEGKLVEPPA